MEIKKVNLEKENHNYHSAFSDNVRKYEVLFLLKEFAEMEANDPLNKDSVFYEPESPSILGFVKTVLPRNKERKQFVSGLMEKYTLLRTTEEGELLTPKDLYYKDKENNVYRSKEKREMLVNDCLNTLNEKFGLDILHIRHKKEGFGLSLQDYLKTEEKELMEHGLIAKGGAIMYDMMPSPDKNIKDYKLEQEKRRALSMKRS
jgi:hypothetical protein